jgi:hypothetical protein
MVTILGTVISEYRKTVLTAVCYPLIRLCLQSDVSRNQKSCLSGHSFVAAGSFERLYCSQVEVAAQSY